MAQTPEIRLISHSDIMYWWPAWVAGYAMALVSYAQGVPAAMEGGGPVAYVHPSNNPGLIFIAILALLLIFTNAKLRGVYSLLTIVTIAFFAVLFAWLDWWDDILALIPNLSAHANMGFYLVFATTFLVIWLLGFFLFDRVTTWTVRPGQLVEYRLVGAGEHTHDTNGLLFEKREQDFFRHILLGLGAGDLRLIAGKDIIDIPNVLFASSKVRAIERLVAVKPDQPLEQTELVMPSSV